MIFFQNFAETSKNVKNITLTLSERQQMRTASVFYKGMFNNKAVIIPNEVTFKRSIVDDSPFSEDLRRFINEKDMLTKEVIANGQKYVNGDLIVISIEDTDRLKVGLIQSILVRRQTVFFVCKVYTCTRHWLQFFESMACQEHYSFVEYKTLADYKPLIKRGTIRKFRFVLHHRVSFSYST